jgi:G3E family GTPase
LDYLLTPNHYGLIRLGVLGFITLEALLTYPLFVGIRSQAIVVLEKLMARRGRLDYVLLEASGLADPTKMIHMFWQDSRLGSAFRLDGVVTLVNAADFLRNLTDDTTTDMFVKQIAMADRVLVNKEDLVTTPTLSEIMNHLHRINFIAQKLTCTRAQVHLSSILDIRAFDIERCTIIMPNVKQIVGDHDVKSLKCVALSLTGMVVDVKQFEGWVQSLLWDSRIPNTTYPIEIYRLKGLFPTSIKGTFLALQAVREHYEIEHITISNGPPLLMPYLSRLFIVCKTEQLTELESSLGAMLQSPIVAYSSL